MLRRCSRTNQKRQGRVVQQLKSRVRQELPVSDISRVSPYSTRLGKVGTTDYWLPLASRPTGADNN